MAGKWNKNDLEKKVRELFKLKKAPSAVSVLDLEAKQLRVLCAEKRGSRMRVARYEEATLEWGPTAKEKEMGAALAKKLKELKIHASGVIWGVPRSEVMLRQMTVPFVEKEGEIASMIHFQITRDLPFRPEDAVIDFSINTAFEVAAKASSEDGQEKEKKAQKQLEVTVAVVPRLVVSHYQEITRAAGLKLLGLGFQSSARVESLRYCGLIQEKASAVSLLLSVTPETSVIEVAKEGHLVFSREASVGVGSVENSAEQETQRIEEITTETVRCLHAYEQDDLHGQINRIFVTHFGKKTGLVIDSLRARIKLAGIEVVEYHPAELLSLKDPLKVSGFALAGEAGLAAGFLEKERLSLDFLNPKKPAVADTGKTRQAVLGAVAFILVLILFFVIRGHVIKVHTAQRDAVQAEFTKLSKNQTLWRQNIIQALSLRTWQSGQRQWLDQLATLSSLLPEATDLYVTSFSTGSRSNMVLSVRASASDVITKLDAQLRQAGYQLKAPAITPVSGRSGYGFQTSMELVLPSKKAVDLGQLEPVAQRPQDDISMMSSQERKELNQKAAAAQAEAKKENPPPQTNMQGPPQERQRKNPNGRARQQQRKGDR